MRYYLGAVGVAATMLLILFLNDNGYGSLALGVGIVLIGLVGIYLAVDEIKNNK